MLSTAGPMPAYTIPTPPTRFIGRSAEIAEFAALLATPDCRLLTLVGPGGIGKTRLAIEIARRALPQFSDGVYFVPLAPISEPHDILSAIIEAVPFQLQECQRDPFEHLLEYLGDKCLLLVLDNFEHLLSAAEKISLILDFAPQVRVLVTSRVALNLQEEWVRALPGMRFPTETISPDPQAYSAVQLFMDRAQRLRANLATTSDLPHVARICQLVEGSPLAIELAAGWLNTLTPADIVTEIERNLDILTTRSRDVTERHRSIAVVFEHSWNLLSPAEQAVFQRLSVFRGGFDREAARHVAGASLPDLAGLVDKSLITLGAGGRYTIHELLRQYGQRHLEADPQAATTYTAHAEYYLRMLSRLEPAIKGSGQIAALDTIEANFENIRSAWHRAIKLSRFDLLDQALESLNLYSDMRTRYTDGNQLFQQAIDALSQHSDDDDLVLARLKMRQLRLILMGGLVNDFDILERIEQCQAAAQVHDSLPEVAYSTYLLGIVTLTTSPYHPPEMSLQVIPIFEQARHYYEQVPDPFYIAEAHVWIGNWQIWREGRTLGLQTLNTGLQMRREIRDSNGIAWTLFNLAEAMLVLSRIPEAETYNLAAYRAMQDIGTIKGIVMCGFKLAVLYLLQGKLEEACAVAKEIEGLARNAYLDGELHVAGIQAAITGLLTEDYTAARQLADRSRSIPQRPFHSYKDTWAFWGTLIAACGQGDYAALRQQHRAILTHWQTGFHEPAAMVICLGTEVVALAHQGQHRAAAELLGLVENQPPEITGWLERWPLMGRIRARLQQAMGSTAFAAALERGEKGDLEQAVLRILQPEATDVHAAANSTLTDPLTERELEVLALIAAGFSNRAIAEELVISEGTVKVHTRHIYNKLGVGSRTQAIARASELHLITP